MKRQVLGIRRLGMSTVVLLMFVVLGSVALAIGGMRTKSSTGIQQENFGTSANTSRNIADVQDAPPTVEPVQHTPSDIETLQRELPFSLQLPKNTTYSTLISAQRLDNSFYGVGAALRYETLNGQLELRQTRPEKTIDLVIDPTNVLKEVDINGNKGVITNPGSPASSPIKAVMYWSNGSYQFEIWAIGNTDFDAMVDMARSLAP